MPDAESVTLYAAPSEPDGRLAVVVIDGGVTVGGGGGVTGVAVAIGALCCGVPAA